MILGKQLSGVRQGKKIIEMVKAIGCNYYDVSALSHYNEDKPYLYLLRKLMSEELNFVAR